MHAPVFLDTSFTNTSNSQMTTFLLKIYAIPIEKAMRYKKGNTRSHKKQKKNLQDGKKPVIILN